MDQPTFADLEYQGKKRKTRRELFLERMDSLIQWQNLEERIRSYYPKARRPRQDGVAIPTPWRSCCGFTVSSSSTI